MKNTAKLIQAIFGAMLLTILMIPMNMIVVDGQNFGPYTFMLFLPLILFFAMGANFKLIPSMIASFICGIAWVMVNGIVLMPALSKVLPSGAVNFIGPALLIFLTLTVHDNLLSKTIVGNVPCMFMGLAQTFFSVMVHVENAPILNPSHLIIIFVYGIILSVLLVKGGFALCNMILGKEWIASLHGAGEAHS